MQQNVPHISSSNYVSNTYGGAQLAGALGVGAQGVGGAGQGLLGGQILQTVAANNLGNAVIIQPKGNHMTARRLVQVVIVDPNENVTLEDCLLYKGEEKLTDATDQELFFELDIRDILEKHNIKRVKMIDKKVKDRTERLEPAKIRDLKMVVVNVASF